MSDLGNFIHLLRIKHIDPAPVLDLQTGLLSARAEVERLKTRLAEAESNTFMAEALNSGDGVYRP